ncbi:MAG: alpha/beta hydrolase [Vicinamibacterales bacterium]|jgi:pimeloyl-ACP methyl ester carboxylesterase|nr:alpha/beta hydrolase [Vicinamibacterales bacterium]
MDYRHILALIAALSGHPGPEFAALRNGGHDPASPVAQIVCPRPFPADEIEGKTIFCGTVQVPEDHAKPDGKKIPLKFTIMKSRSQYPEPDPLVYLQGGPGGSSFAIMDKLARVYEPWRKTRDIIFWDQRSAGLSGHSVNCYNALAANAVKIAKGDIAMPQLDTPDKDGNIVSECLKELNASGVDIAKYNTYENAKDVRSIMTALGYPTYNLYGISYGTKLALETMRVAPQGVRSVIIDGVAPSWVHLYDTFALKFSEPIDYVVSQCKADEACDKAYPDLEKVIIETLTMAKAGKITYRGQKVDAYAVFAPFAERNGHDANMSMTPYIPAYVYELYRGKETPTVDMLVDKGFRMPVAGDKEVAAASAALPKRQQALIATLSDNAAVAQRVHRSNANVMAELREAMDETGAYGPVAVLFDRELEKALRALKAEGPAKLERALTNYVALQNVEPSKQALAGFVKDNIQAGAEKRLLALVESMNDAEVAGSFAIIKRDAASSEAGFFGNMYLYNYACQEDVPFNTFGGYQAFTASLKYPYLGDVWGPMAKMFFGACSAFTPQPRQNWQEPVVSDIPTLSIGGLYDTQTPASWAKVATEKLSNAQVFLIPEAGHGALLYQRCVADMGVAFTTNPARKLDDTCPKSIKVEWNFPDWTKKK